MKTKMYRLILPVILIMISSIVGAQITLNIGGNISDQNNQPVIGKQVLIHVDSATNPGQPFTYSGIVTTDINGNYSDSVILPAGTSLARVLATVSDCFNIPQSNVQWFSGTVSTMIMNFIICKVYNAGLPYFDSFDTVNTWYTDSVAVWQHGAPTGSIINSALSGSNAWVTNLNGTYPNNIELHLYSPVFNTMNLTAVDTLRLGFNHWVAAANINHRARVQYSTNGGFSWINLGFLNDTIHGINWYNSYSGGLQYFNYTNSGWMFSSYKLDPNSFNGQQSVQFRFKFDAYTSGTSDGWAIDNVTLAFCSPPQPAVCITNILYPLNDTTAGIYINPSIMLKNTGATILNMIPLESKINGLLTSAEVWSGNMQPGDSAIFTFAIPYQAPAGPYMLCIRTIMPFPLYNNCERCDSFAGLPLPTGTLSGFLNTQSGAAGPSDVFLIQHDSVAGTLTAIDTILSVDTAGTTTYTFLNVVSGNYLVKAAMLSGNPNYAGNIPSYHQSSLFWSNATTVSVQPNITTQASIDFVQGINPGGPGFIGGQISQGANKGPGDPVEGSQIMLLDAGNSDQPVAYTYSDASGIFGFSNIPLGVFKVYAEVLDKTTIPALITIDASNPSNNGVRLVVGSSVVTYVDEEPVSEEKWIGQIYPNPSGQVCYLPVILKNDSGILLLIKDMTGRVILHENHHFNTGHNLLSIETGNMEAGLYTVIISGNNTVTVTRKLVVR